MPRRRNLSLNARVSGGIFSLHKSGDHTDASDACIFGISILSIFRPPLRLQVYLFYKLHRSRSRRWLRWFYLCSRRINCAGAYVIRAVGTGQPELSRLFWLWHRQSYLDLRFFALWLRVSLRCPHVHQLCRQLRRYQRVVDDQRHIVAITDFTANARVKYSRPLKCLRTVQWLHHFRDKPSGDLQSQVRQLHRYR